MAPTAETITFDTAPTGTPPAGWTAGQTGSGRRSGPSKRTRPRPASRMCSSNRAGHISGLYQGRTEHQRRLRSGEFADLGSESGGRLWRAKDANTITSPARITRRQRDDLSHNQWPSHGEQRTSIKVASNQWHTLRVDFQANHFTVTFDGKKAIEWDDDTFKDAGRIGVWTKADSVTLFDDFSFSGE